MQLSGTKHTALMFSLMEKEIQSPSQLRLFPTFNITTKLNKCTFLQVMTTMNSFLYHSYKLKNK